MSMCRQKADCNGVIGDGLAVIYSQQVTPVGIAIGIDDRIQYSAQSVGGVGIFLPGKDIAGIIVGPDEGFAQLHIALTDEFVSSVMFIYVAKMDSKFHLMGS